MKISTNSKVMLAILFAGGIVGSLPRYVSADDSEIAQCIARELLNNKQFTPELRAYNLLRLACRCLGDRASSVENNLTSRMEEPAFYKTWQSFLILWTTQASYAEHERKANKKSVEDTQVEATTKINTVMADRAIEQALKQLDASSDTFAKMNLYYIASLLYERTGNVQGKNRCDRYLEVAFKACQAASSIDENAVQAASCILNASAYGYIQIQIADSPRANKTQRERTLSVDLQPNIVSAETFTDNDFKESEKLKLRAVAMVDRLSSTNHVRRKAHRDLALWYLQLGKKSQSEEQKEILFQLVGVRDDSILYPQLGMCGGGPMWWQTSQRFLRMNCGMG